MIAYGLIAEWNFNTTLASTELSVLGVPEGVEVVYLVEATVYDPALPGTRVLRYCSGAGYVYGGNYYEPRITHPGRIRRMLFDEGKTSGPSQMGYGEVVLVNSDGALDALSTYGFDGRSLMIKRAWAIGATLASVLTLAACGMEQATFTWDEVAIRIKDRKQELNVPLQANKYGGSNALPNGLDGTADIQGRPKPLLFGSAKNITPVCVNTSRLIYQLHDGALAAISGVYDKGVPLSAGAAYNSQADMEANAPVAGQYRPWLAGGMFRLGAAPAAQVTADASEGATALERSAARLLERLAARAIAAGDIDAADTTALHTANSAEVGYYSAAETTVSTALDAVMGSIGAWYGFDVAGKLRCGRLDAPAGSPVATLTEAELLTIERLPTSDEGRGLPAWRVNLGYDRNWSPAASGWAAYHLLTTVNEATLPVSQRWYSAAHSGNMTIITGRTAAADFTDKYAYSYDGVTWFAGTFPSAMQYEAITYGNGIFVTLHAGGVGGYYSADGINWTAITLPAGSFSIRSLAYGNGLFVAGVNTNLTITSPDGINWTVRTIPTGTLWTDIVFGGGKFILSSGTGFLVSSDGITFVAPTWVGSPPASRGKFAFNGSYWGNVTPDGLLCTSSDGYTWEITGTSQVKGNLYSGEGFFFLASYYGVSTAIYTSFDGVYHTLLRRLTISTYAYSSNGALITAVNNGSGVSAYLPAIGLKKAQWLTREGSTTTASNSAIQTIHPLARELSVDTLLVSAAAAQTEAARLLALHQVDRVRLRVKVPRSRVPADVLGQPVQLQVPRYGWQAGKLLVVIGAEEDLAADLMWLDLWG